MDWDDKRFKQWLILRDQLRISKRNKDWNASISICHEIIDLDASAKFINIFLPIIRKDLGFAYQKSGQFAESIREYAIAIELFKQAREIGETANPDDWEREIYSLANRIIKLKNMNKDKYEEQKV